MEGELIFSPQYVSLSLEGQNKALGTTVPAHCYVHVHIKAQGKDFYWFSPRYFPRFSFTLMSSYSTTVTHSFIWRQETGLFTAKYKAFVVILFKH